MKSFKTRLPPEVVKQIAKPHKYRAESMRHADRKYPSKAQARRALELDLLKECGDIAWWLPEVPIMIGEPGVDRSYRVDFLVATPLTMLSAGTGIPFESYDTGFVKIHAEDVKGVETASFKRHVRQWRLRGPFPLHIISKSGTEIIPAGEGL